MAVRLLILLLGLLAGFGIGRLLAALGFGSGVGAATNTAYLTVAGLLLAFLLAPRLERLAGGLARSATDFFSRLEPRRVAAVTVGLVVALLLSVLIGSVLANAPFYTWYWNALVTAGLAAFFVYFALQNAAAFTGLAWTGTPRRRTGAKVLDTNVIIDGRITELARAGFLEGEVIVPSFVLRELQFLADHADPQRRVRGKRGLTVLEELRAVTPITVHEWAPPPDAGPAASAVDDQLIHVTRELGAKLVTNDANLSKVARLYGLKVLSIHEAALAMRPKLAAGEILDVTVTKNGQQAGQGVGYLDDGTMIVVEDGQRHKGQTVRVTVVSNVQTSVGRMVFARVENG